jgi:3-oxoadipate enol-lactonase
MLLPSFSLTLTERRINMFRLNQIFTVLMLGVLLISACQPIQAPEPSAGLAKRATGGEPTTGFAEVNGTRLYYEMAGTGDAVVLLHGLAVDSRYWQAQFDALSQHYQVVRYDLRGFGKSALPTTEPYTHADDLKALLDYLGIERAHLIGNSFGGVNAINFALAYPEATRSLILVDNEVQGAEGLPPATAEENDAWAAVFAALEKGDKRAASEAAVDLHPYFIVAKTMPAVRSQLINLFTDYSWWHFQGNQDPVRIPEIPAAKRLGEIKAPTLVIIGERDNQDIQVLVDMTVKGIPGAQKVIMPGLDHVPFLEDPAGFNQIVLEFLADK